MCIKPVGLGAMRVIIVPSISFLAGYFFSRSSGVGSGCGNNILIIFLLFSDSSIFYLCKHKFHYASLYLVGEINFKPERINWLMA